MSTVKERISFPKKEVLLLTLKAAIKIVADDIQKNFFIVVFFPEKIRIDISCESSARQRIHIKHQTLFLSKDKNEIK